MMSDYYCHSCERKYNFNEYSNLEEVSRVTEDPNDKYGIEKVCECGKKFHSDRWSNREEIETPDGDMTVSTVNLTIAHGPNRNQLYETCVFHEYGNNVVDRYSTKMEARNGHEKYIELVKDEEYRLEKGNPVIYFD